MKNLWKFLIETYYGETVENRQRGLILLYGEKAVDISECAYSKFVGPMTPSRWFDKRFESACFSCAGNITLNQHEFIPNIGEKREIVKLGTCRQKSTRPPVEMVMTMPTADGSGLEHVKRLIDEDKYNIYQSILQRLILDDLVEFEEIEGMEIVGTLLVVKRAM